ncbi:MAG TPA: hypothetical protein VK152_11595 [Paludibacter sp.]|nr:hypothetical protein [Paludibacter sp.]
MNPYKNMPLYFGIGVSRSAGTVEAHEPETYAERTKDGVSGALKQSGTVMGAFESFYTRNFLLISITQWILILILLIRTQKN